MVFKMQIIKKELRFDDSLKKRLEFICEFSKVNPTFIKVKNMLDKIYSKHYFQL